MIRLDYANKCSLRPCGSSRQHGFIHLYELDSLVHLYFEAVPTMGIVTSVVHAILSQLVLKCTNAIFDPIAHGAWHIHLCTVGGPASSSDAPFLHLPLGFADASQRSFAPAATITIAFVVPGRDVRVVWRSDEEPATVRQAHFVSFTPCIMLAERFALFFCVRIFGGGLG